MQDLNTEINNFVHEYAAGVDIKARSYTGRGYGAKECLGLVGESSVVRQFVTTMLAELIGEHVNDAIVAGRDNDIEAECDHKDRIQELIETLVNHKEDSMGLDRIIYFPPVQYQEPDDQEEQN